MAIPSIATADPLDLLNVTITGTVTDRLGAPLEGVRISDGDKSVWTLPDGTYSIEEQILNGFSICASRTGLVTDCRSGTALPGKVVDFHLYYQLGVTLTDSENDEVAISGWSYAPPDSCFEWTDLSSGQTLTLSLVGTENGKSTWEGLFDASSTPGTYGSRSLVVECAGRTPLTLEFQKSYTIT